jgi:uncharacterized membrane protein
MVAAASGGAVAVVAAFLAPWQAVPLLGWTCASSIWALWAWFVVLRLDATETEALATREDPHGATTYLLLISASVASLIAVVLGVIKAADLHGDQRAVLLASGIMSIITSWGVVHTIFTLRYAALYYTGVDGGIDFNQEEKPTYTDFAYLAFTIGMTYQVSDTNLTTPATRHTALRHALLSYLFGTAIFAATINLAAGLAK